MASPTVFIKKEKTRNLPRLLWVLPLLVMGVAAAAYGQGTDEAGVQVLTRGPIHEAFAEASMMGATAGAVIPKMPNDPITELPPDQRPEGDNVAWVPGYWSWDDDRSDFIWLSGVWRDLPPGRQWIPGYWARVEGGSRWISGFWGDAAQNEVSYLPTPPRSLEAGPNSPAPGPEGVWSSGSWIWQQSRYDWQPGYWVIQQPEWVWTPSHYTWTPRGYVYVKGYWDHDIEHRGVMFAPVYYEQPVYSRPSYSYSPNILIDLVAIAASLFVQSGSNHYYYGDYYDARYEERGIYPWHSNQARQYGDDPMYVHYRSSQLQRDPDWDNHMDAQYRHRREHVDARPPQTLALQVNIINTQRAGAPESVVIGRSLAEAVQSDTQPLRFTRISMDERKHIEARGRDVRNLQFERAVKETPSAPAKKAKGDREHAKAVTVKLPASPVAASPAENVEAVKAPPPLPVAPKPQTARDEGRRVKQDRVEAKAENPKSQKKPGKAKGNARSKPDEIEVQPSATSENPKRVKPAPVTTNSESKPQTPAAKAEPSKHESAPATSTAMAIPDSGTPPVVETPGAVKEAVTPEAKPEELKAEVTSQELKSPNAEHPRSDTKELKKQKSKGDHASGKEDKKNNKS